MWIIYLVLAAIGLLFVALAIVAILPPMEDK